VVRFACSLGPGFWAVVGPFSEVVLGPVFVSRRVGVSSVEVVVELGSSFETDSGLLRYAVVSGSETRKYHARPSSLAVEDLDRDA
jgi:hypothetical protein